MLNKAIWVASRLSLSTMLTVSMMFSVGSFAQDSEFVEEVASPKLFYEIISLLHLFIIFR